jgi:hypothetical protein
VARAKLREIATGEDPKQAFAAVYAIIAMKRWS